MSVSDRWEGAPAGECGCGNKLIWTREGGEWRVTHLDPARALYCSSQTTSEHPSDVDTSEAMV